MSGLQIKKEVMSGFIKSQFMAYVCVYCNCIKSKTSTVMIWGIGFVDAVLFI